MDLSWNDRKTRQFVTNVGLITSEGPLGPNIMAAEWIHHISYSPSLVAAIFEDMMQLLRILTSLKNLVLI